MEQAKRAVALTLMKKNLVDFSPPFEVKGGNSFKVQTGCN
jgi:hypothetical protein